MLRIELILLGINILVYGIMAIFSYAYVDLNLTLTQNPQLLNILGYLQQLGYFNRPEATVIYVTLIVITFSLFIINLSLFYTKKIGLK